MTSRGRSRDLHFRSHAIHHIASGKKPTVQLGVGHLFSIVAALLSGSVIILLPWIVVSFYDKQVYVEPPPSGISMTVPAFAAEHRRAPAARCSYRYLLQTPALSSKPAGRRCCCRSMGRTDGRTLDRYIDPAPHTMRAALIKCGSLLLNRPKGLQRAIEKHFIRRCGRFNATD